MKKYILAIFLTLPSLLFGQGWEKTYGEIYDDYAWSVLQTNDGGYITTGYTTAFNSNSLDVMLLKTDAQGNESWSQTYGGVGVDIGYKVLQNQNGNFFIAGRTSSQSTGDYDIFLLKTDNQGNELWTKTYGGLYDDVCADFIITSDDDLILTGYTMENGDPDIYVVKVDSSGNEIWNNSYGNDDDDLGASVIETSNGEIVITGLISDSLSSGNFFELGLLKIDSLGNTIWMKTYGGSGFQEGYSLIQTNDNYYVVCGISRSSITSENDIYVVKIDSIGDLIWEVTIGGVGDDWTNTIIQTVDNKYLIAGGVDSIGGGSIDACIIKLDTSGVEEWRKMFGGSDNDAANSVQQTSDNGFIIAGATESYGSGAIDFYLIKTDAQGNVSSIANDIVNSNNNSALKIVDLLGRETEPQPNTPLFYLFDDGTVEKKVLIE